MESYAEIRENIMLKYDKGYSKLLDPLRTTYCYNSGQLKSYLNYSKILCDDLIYKMGKVKSQESVYKCHYESKLINVTQVLIKISRKVHFLLYKLCKDHSQLEKLLEEESEDQNCLIEEVESIDSKISDVTFKCSQRSNQNLLKREPRQQPNLEFSLTSLDFKIEKCFLSPKAFGEIVKSIDGVSIHSTCLATEALIKILVKMEVAINGILQSPNNCDFSELFYRSEYLRCYEDTLHEIIQSPDDEIYYLDITHNSNLSGQTQIKEQVTKFQNILKIVLPENQQMYMTRYKYFCYFVELAFAISSKALSRNSYFMKIVKTLVHSPVYVFSKRRMRSQYKAFITSGDLDLLLKIAKSTGSTFSRFCCYFINPWIKFHKKIYIPKSYDRLDMKSLNKCLDDFLMTESSPELNKLSKKLHHSLSFTHRKPKQLTPYKETFTYKKKPDCLCLRIVSPFPVFLSQNPSKGISKITDCDAVLIHIHGGGFVCQTTSQHQIYLRRWSKQNNIPVLMLSYTLAPEAKYPESIDECYQQYRWIVDNIETSLGLRPKKIFLSGDSAGGLIGTDLIALAICKKFRIPDGFISIYPALLLKYEAFTPSRINLFDDKMMNQLVKEACYNAYCKDIDPDQNPFLCPMFLPDQILQRFPPTRISLAGLDPIHDDGYKFAYRLSNLGKDVICVDNKLLPHGFLNFGLVPLIGSECNRAIDNISSMISELINS
ncbi:unnamed protein product [Moneuplotes crassus]|uniref:Alpha/beta hydrolase fold-3 domain-containing protein n=1 Tax=Euplotes crassus TaxID=5936 RepID=A0AAD1YDS0_EUPCR|nr:unnamed protein product [Moneuplotes crassus]